MTWVDELAFPVSAPTNELDVMTPDPPTPAPKVMLGVLGLHAIFVAKTLLACMP